MPSLTYDIVCVAFPSWEGDYVKSTVKLMEQLGKRHQVLYLDYPYTWKDWLLGVLGRNKVPVARMLGLQDRLRAISLPEGGTVQVLTGPPVVPTNFIKAPTLYNYIQRFNARLIRRTVLRAYKRLSIQSPVVINAFNPFIGVPLAGTLNERLLVYYCYDEIATCAWALVHGARVERELVALADAVVVSSKGLQDTKQKLGKPTFLVNNGVDFAEFSRGQAPVESKPASPRKMGYVGSIDSRLDYPLLHRLATAFPDCEIELVGRETYDKPGVEASIEQLKKRPNVTFVGAQPPAQLPGYLRGFRVGLIPFVKNTQTAAIYPMKINEYLAAGVPVVSTDFAPLNEFRPVVAICTDQEAFVREVEAALFHDTSAQQTARVALAQQNAWDQRAHEMETIIEKLLTGA